MLIHFRELSLDEARLREWRTRLVEYWSALWDCDDSGGTTWDVLEEIGQQVTGLLERGEPDDICRALELTARAECLRRVSGDGT